jgi:hypothetical protein
VTKIPTEARNGLMRAWLALLSEKHPGVHWIPAGDHEVEDRVGNDAVARPNEEHLAAA